MGEAWLKESTPMETNKICFFLKLFSFLSFEGSKSPLNLRWRGVIFSHHDSNSKTTLHTFASIPELFCCTCEGRVTC